MAALGLLDRVLFRFISGAAQLLILSAVLAAFYQVLARFILQTPADWSGAWTRFALIWTVLLGISLAFRQGSMLAVQTLHDALKGAARRRLEDLVLLICLGFLGFLFWVGLQMAWRVRFQTVPSLEISISWIYAAIPLGAALAIVALLARWAELRLAGPRS